ncbi:acyl-CoA-binding protein (macronuclear) [Tetrahymena thermophila SB210]|uniref:Acyl-CoA-binding protein n=1 Tax=Tetrahymena thermophila (strain SB210) TaxID=312017 RepID=Q232M9_TETTS|nr:acyl-CoA-binding protein [Tetrahymena thermophila SB210]EAR91383.3 acyl-CoA-binding protein [Tetrahymena thermophila SB210]|eukprot:XP_001011628.3 acyl-CoA-binding protein [Tetrahymena thermophila SB210]
MTSLEERYNKALEFIKNPPADYPPIDMDNTQRLTFYAIFRQIKDGPCKGPQPSRLKVVERAKYDAWKALGKMSKEDAMKKYITEITKLAPGWEKPTPKL